MKMIIQPPAGSANDAYARHLVRRMINHIPGNPPIMLPVNMPGGCGIRVESKLGMFTTT